MKTYSFILFKINDYFGSLSLATDNVLKPSSSTFTGFVQKIHKTLSKPFIKLIEPIRNRNYTLVILPVDIMRYIAL